MTKSARDRYKLELAMAEVWRAIDFNIENQRVIAMEKRGESKGIGIGIVDLAQELSKEYGKVKGRVRVRAV